MGFNSTEITPQHKLSLYKIYGRPVLLYGLESLQLTQQEIQKLQRTEANTIKASLRLNKRCRTKKLLYAIGLETTANTLKRIKCNLILRILKNPLTRQLLHQLIKEKQTTNKDYHKKSILSEMIDINGIESTDEHDLKNDTIIRITFLNEELNVSEGDEMVKEIRDLLDNYDYRTGAKKLGEMLRAF